LSRLVVLGCFCMFLDKIASCFMYSSTSNQSSKIADKDFWDSFKKGALSAGLNHGVHDGWPGANVAVAVIKNLGIYLVLTLMIGA
jgi:hypothetical protein